MRAHTGEGASIGVDVFAQAAMDQLLESRLLDDSSSTHPQLLPTDDKALGPFPNSPRRPCVT
eukprot:3709989-Pyramimonas_sp.AAC.1